MIKVLYIKVLLFPVLFLAQIKVTYKVVYQPDSTVNNFNTEEMTLKHYKNTSYFYNETKFKLDSIYDRITLDFVRTGIAASPSLKYELNFGIVKDFIKSNYSEIQHINGREFIFNYTHHKLKWKIDDRSPSKKILNYDCKKATLNFGGRNWTAWFTDEIPISDGPYKFEGLPGLILEIEDEKSSYLFSAVALENFSEKVSIPSKMIRTDYQEFIKLQNKLLKDPALFVRESVMRNSNVAMKDTNGDKLESTKLFERIDREFRTFLKSHNNPIEKGSIWLR